MLLLLLLLLLRLQLLWLLLVWLLSCLYQKLSIAQLAARQTGGVQRSRLAGSRQAQGQAQGQAHGGAHMCLWM